MFSHTYPTLFVFACVCYVLSGSAQASDAQMAHQKDGKVESARLPCLEGYLGLQNRPKRGFVGVGTKIRFVSLSDYTQTWADQVDASLKLINPTLESEYPDANLEVRFTVEVLPLGQIGAIEVDRSSGFKRLDALAVSTLRKAAPFAPFPQDICMKVDILHMVGVVQFTSSGAQLKRPH